MLEPERLEKHNELVKRRCNRHVILLDHIDPDSTGSAAGYLAVIKKLNPKAKVKIFYSGELGYEQNKIIFETFQLSRIMKPVREYVCEENDCIIFLDTHEHSSRSPEAIRGLRPNIIFDHHAWEPKEESADQFFFVTEEIGATATMIACLSFSEKIKLNFEAKENKDIALLLSLGIHADTHSLTVRSKMDIEMESELHDYIDLEKFIKLVFHRIPESFYLNEAKAISLMQKEDTRLVSVVGHLSEDCMYDPALIANHLIRMKHRDHKIKLVVLGAIIGKAVKIYARSTDKGINLNEFLRAQFDDLGGGKEVKGFGEGGAHFEINLGPLLGKSKNAQFAFDKYLLTILCEKILGVPPKIKK